MAEANIFRARVSTFINQILTDFGMSQAGLARILGISQDMVSRYSKGKDLPRADVLVRLAELAGVTIDEMLKSDAPPKPREISIPPGVSVEVGGNAKVGGGVFGNVEGDVYHNTTVRRVYRYVYEPGDLTDEQSARLHQLVDEIVNLEATVKRAPKTHSAVWGALRRKFKVPYYRKIGENNFETAAQYLKMWKGRLTRPLARKDKEAFRLARYRSIFGTARKELGWTKEDVHGYVFSEYGVTSLTQLSEKQLNQLYSRIMKMKYKSQK